MDSARRTPWGFLLLWLPGLPLLLLGLAKGDDIAIAIGVLSVSPFLIAIAAPTVIRKAKRTRRKSRHLFAVILLPLLVMLPLIAAYQNIKIRLIPNYREYMVFVGDSAASYSDGDLASPGATLHIPLDLGYALQGVYKLSGFEITTPGYAPVVGYTSSTEAGPDLLKELPDFKENQRVRAFVEFQLPRDAALYGRSITVHYKGHAETAYLAGAHEYGWSVRQVAGDAVIKFITTDQNRYLSRFFFLFLAIETLLTIAWCYSLLKCFPKVGSLADR